MKNLTLIPAESKPRIVMPVGPTSIGASNSVLPGGHREVICAGFDAPTKQETYVFAGRFGAASAAAAGTPAWSPPRR